MKSIFNMKNMILAVLLVMMTVAAPNLANAQVLGDTVVVEAVVEETKEETPVVKKGWTEEKDGIHYYRDGKSLTGWQEIKGKYYYFKKQVLQVNCIAGNKTDGYYYVGEDGVRVDDKVMNMAVKVIRKNTNPDDSKKVKLKKAFLAFRKYQYLCMEAKTPDTTSIPKYAEWMFTKKKGNCYRFASVMTYAAKAIGYDVRFIAGNVFRKGNPHGWCEVKSKGKWQMIDVSLQRNTKKSLYRISIKDYPYWVKRLYSYPMTAVNGKIIFKKIAIG